jgi:hypothetical protein
MTAPANAADLVAAGLLPFVLERLPPMEQCLTVSRLGRGWRVWAAPRQQRLREIQRGQVAHGLVWDWMMEDGPDRRDCPPLWALREAWPELTPRQKDRAAVRAAHSGAGAELEFTLCEGGYKEGRRFPPVCVRVSSGRRPPRRAAVGAPAGLPL